MSFVTIFSPPNPLNTFNNGWQVGGGRFEVPSSLLTAATGKTLVRVTIKTYSTTSSGNIDDCWIGESGGLADRWAFDGNQVQLKFNGATNKTGITGAQTIVTDAVPFTYDPAKTLIVALHFSGTQLDLAAETTVSSCTYDYNVSGTSTSSSTDPTMSNPNNNGNVGLALIEMGDAANQEYGTSDNVATYKTFGYRDYSRSPRNLNLYAPGVIPAPPVGSLLGSPFDTKSYLIIARPPLNPNLFPAIAPNLPGVNSQLGVPFNGLGYRDPANYDPSPNAFLPRTIQAAVQSLLGAPFEGWNYRVDPRRPLNPNLYLPPVAPMPIGAAVLGVPLSSLSYIDRSTLGDNNGILPNIIQTPTSTFLNFVENQTSYDSKSFLDPRHYRGDANAFLPGTIQPPVQSLLGVSFNGLNYREYPGSSTNQNLFPIVSVSPFFNQLALASFNSVSYRDSFFDGSAFLPRIIQSPVQSLLGAPFASLSYRDNVVGWTTFLQNVIQSPVQSLLGSPFSSLSYRDSFVVTGNPGLFQAATVANPFAPPLPAAPFNSLSYRDTVLYDNTNGFLPGTVQGQVQSLLGSPFNALAYRDTANVGDNAFLPQTIQAPTSTFLNVVENAAPFNAETYRDSYVSQTSYGLFPPPSGPSPFFNPFPFVRFDTKGYADNTGLLENAFLPGTIQGQIQSLLGVPFNALAFSDPANIGNNAFLPGTIQSLIQSLLGVPFRSLGYLDSASVSPGLGLYTPVVGAPFAAPILSVIFNSLTYRDSSAVLRNPSLYTQAVANPFFLPALQAVFNALSFRDAANVGENAFLPQAIQGQVQSLIGSPFAPISYLDNFIAPRDFGLYQPAVIGVPFPSRVFQSAFSGMVYRDTLNYGTPGLFLRPQPGEFILLQGALAQFIALYGTYATQFINLIGSATQISVPAQTGQPKAMLSTDFTVYTNRNATIRIAIQDQYGNWLLPPFTTGYFSVEPYALKTPETIVFSRNTIGSNVRFTSLVAGQWYLDSDILPADTVNLSPGVYSYEARLDFSGGQYELKSGVFNLVSTYI